MSHQIYSNRQFKIYETLYGYIVHNSCKPFEQGHTHIKNYNTAKYLVYLSIHKIVPKKLQTYLMVSLIRISDDLEYISRLSSKLQEGGYTVSCNKSKCGSKSTKKNNKKGSKKKPK